MKTITTKKLFAFIIMVMFSSTFVNAQTCPDNKIRVYKRVGASGGCVSHCVSWNNMPPGWSTSCSAGRLANEQAGGEIFTLAVSPNPVSASTTVLFYVGQTENVSLKIFDVSGRLVTTLADASFEEGDHEITWNAADVNAGIYFLRFETAGYSENQKLIVAK